MNLNLTTQEKDFLFFKHLNEGKGYMESKEKVKDVDRSLRSIKEHEKFERAKEKAFLKNFKKEFNKLK